MSAARSISWFAQHEARLAWRDMLSMMTAGRRDRERKVVFGVLVFVVFMHGVAYLVLRHTIGIDIRTDMPTLIVVTAGTFLSGSAILSQAMESVTRTFYARSDLEFILSAPVNADRLFAVRMVGLALTSASMSVFLIGPFIDVLAFVSGPSWLGAYGVLVAVSLVTTALAIVLTFTLFRVIGPKRTRLVAQIVAAVIGGMFVIGLQIAAMFSAGSYSRLAFVQSKYVLARAPDVHSIFWWPARAALGDGLTLVLVISLGVALFVGVTALYAPRFARYFIAAAGISHGAVPNDRATGPFRLRPAASALRHKERLLILRDPWLISQSLMQLLYLVPPALLLSRSFEGGVGAPIILVSVLIMAAGQLAGGLAWLAVSGEDAPDLVYSAPLAAYGLLRAKIEAVMQCVAVVFGPFVLALALVSMTYAITAAIGIAAAAGSSVCVQLWFRSQSARSQFRRRHTSSRIATFAEAFVSITWAAAGAVASGGSWLAAPVIVIAITILVGVRFLSPGRLQTDSRSQA
jgi:ABC-2 type transport system permease protein